MNTRKLPKFIRQSATAYSRLGKKWRKPKGKQSKLREKQKSHGSWPTVGYGAERELRYLHPSNLKETLVHSTKDLEKIDSKSHAIKIAHAVGKRKREIILKKAKELGIKILNP